jgi:hypothetical protein
MTETTMQAYPGYDIVQRAEIEGLLHITTEDKLALATRHTKHYRAGSVVSYARTNDICPIKAVERTIAKGESLWWINALCTSITSHQRPREKYIAVRVGQMVRFEGRTFRILSAPNDNLSLKEEA